MKMKKAAAVLLVLVLAFSCVGVTAFADDNAVPFAYEEYGASSNLSANGYDIKMNASCMVYSDISELKIEITLEKFWGLFIWNNHTGPVTRDFYNTGKEKRCSLDDAVIGAESGTYRLKSVFNLTKTNGEKISFTIYSNEIKVPK